MINMRESKPHSFDETLQLLLGVELDKKLNRYRSKYAFRGLASSEYDLKPAIQREHYAFDKAEKAFLRNFKKYGEIKNKDSINDWQLMTLAQHHGIPTRLLDWTWSPLVALHFATDKMDKMDKDGAVYSIDVEKSLDILPNKLMEELKKENHPNLFTIDILKNFKLEDIENISSDPFYLFFEPESMDPRIINQYGFFSIVNKKNGYTIDEILEERKMDIIQKIIIRADLKWEIRDKLDNSNINGRMLFPGLDGLADWLKRHYFVRKNI